MLKKSRFIFFIKGFFYKFLLQDMRSYLSNYLRYASCCSYRCIAMPTKVKKFTVVRSPFVSKLSREQFEVKTYKNVLLVDFLNPIISKSYFIDTLSYFKKSYVNVRLQYVWYK